MKEPVEIISDYTDDDNYTHIDAYYDTDPNSEGKTVAIVCLDTSKVFFLDNGLIYNKKVLSAIEDVKSSITIK